MLRCLLRFEKVFFGGRRGKKYTIFERLLYATIFHGDETRVNSIEFVRSRFVCQGLIRVLDTRV